MIPDPASKDSLRRAMLERLRALPADYVQAQSAALCERVLPILRTAERVCLYAPLPHEVNLLPLLEAAPEVEFYFPRCLPGRQLSFHRVHSAAALQPGAMGIPTPPAHLPQLAPEAAQLILVPGVAFTTNGQRLGYGGGYYDRFLPRCPQAHTLALALPEQILPQLPTDTYDIPLHRVLAGMTAPTASQTSQ